jgi:hypothetical protein
MPGGESSPTKQSAPEGERVSSEDLVIERDECPGCGWLVPGRPATPAAEGALQRGSCRSCGLQLVREPGRRWREIRG